MFASFEASSQRRGVEVHEQADWVAGDLLIGDQLRHVNGRQPLDGFDFDHQRLLDDQVQYEMACDPLAAVDDRHMTIGIDVHVRCDKLQGQAFPIDGLQQSWAKRSVNGNRAADHTFTQLIESAV